MSNASSLHTPDPSRGEGPGGVPVTAVAGTRDDLDVLAAAVAEAEAALARAALAAGRLAGSGVCEQVEGLPLERFIGLEARWVHRDAADLVGTGEVLGDAPVLAGLVSAGTVSFSQARSIRRHLRPLSKAQRAVVDERIGAAIAEHGGVDAFDPDGLVEAVERAADDCRQKRSREQRDRRAQAADRLQVQQGLDGRVKLFGDYNAVTGAAIVNALDAAADAPTGSGDGSASPTVGGAGAGDRAGEPHDGAAGIGPAGSSEGTGHAGDPDPSAADADTPRWVHRTARGASYADALAAIAAEFLAGHACEQALRTERADAEGDEDGGPDDRGRATDGPYRGRCTRRQARPLVVAHVDLAQLTGHLDGQIELAVRGGMPRVCAATVEALVASGDVRAVLFEGGRPLAATGKVDASQIPVTTRMGVRARDRGCRFPSSRDPIGHADLHHLIEQSRGGTHDPDNLACLSRRWHTTVHAHGWSLTLDPATGKLTMQRRGRRYHSLPRGTPLPPPPAPPDRRPPTTRPRRTPPPGERASPPDDDPGDDGPDQPRT